MLRGVVLGAISLDGSRAAWANDGAARGELLGATLPIWSVVPFVVLLLSIGILPLVRPHFWERNRNKAIVSLVIAVPFAVGLWLGYGHEGARELVHSLRDYVSFIVLIGALFVISGGIYLRSSLSGTPIANTGFLAAGAVLANVMGTTGASAVLIRPLLRANEHRLHKAHVVIFFIFIVSNCGGLLTPLGDPPLFLGFLKGVPFSWTLGLWKQWLLVSAAILLVFNFYDQYLLNREERERPGAVLDAVMEHAPLRVEGWHNVFFLLGIILVVIGKGQGLGTGGDPWPFGLQEVSMVVIAAAAYGVTNPALRAGNRYTSRPIIEVAVLFLGIFVTMIAPLQILNARGAELGLVKPWQLFWCTGLLSSFLDNAPTYLTFAATAAGQFGVSVEHAQYLAEFLMNGVVAERLLAAVSCGAVMMGANSYIGNGPNFMVKAIAEENGVRMPSFFGYMAYSTGILLPIFLVVTLVFFR
jgi:Na+/H+ antiporter NhaD/arsenite permease-like protein